MHADLFASSVPQRESLSCLCAKLNIGFLLGNLIFHRPGNNIFLREPQPSISRRNTLAVFSVRVRVWYGELFCLTGSRSPQSKDSGCNPWYKAVVCCLAYNKWKWLERQPDDAGLRAHMEGVSLCLSPKSCSHNTQGSVLLAEALFFPVLSHLHPACPPRELVHVALKIGR